MAENPLAPGPLQPIKSTPKSDKKNTNPVPGDSVIYPAASKKGLAPGKFYVDQKSGEIYQVGRPGSKDILFVGFSDKKNSSTTSSPKGGSLPPGWDFRPASNAASTTKEVPGDTVRNPAASKTGLAAGKFYIDPNTGNVMQVAKPGFVDPVVLDAETIGTDGSGGDVLKSLETKLAEAKTAYDPFDPIKRPSGIDEPKTVLYNRRQVTKAQLKKIVDDFQKQVNTITKAAKPIEDKAKALREEVAKDELLEERGAPGKRLTPAQRQEKNSQAKTLEDQAKQIKTTGNTTGEVTPATTTTTAPAATTAAPATTATPAPAVPATTATTIAPKTTTTTPATPAVVSKPGATTLTPGMTSARTATPEAAATKTTKGAGKTTTTTTKKVTKKPVTDWSTIVQQEFGPLWDVYNTNTDVKKVLDDAVAGGYFNDEVQMAEKLRGTTWFQTTERSARQFAIRQSTDPAQVDDEINVTVEEFRASALANGFTFDDATLRKLATDSKKFGWSATQTQNALGSEAVAQAQGRGAQGMKDLRSGTLGQNLRKIAAGYAQKPSEATFDQFVIEIMNGTKTETQFTDAMRESAKSQFRSLQPGLDKGSDVDTLLAGYKQQAAQVLGSAVDTSQIDWTSDKWNKALNYRDEKTNEYRQMDLWEWNKYLRTLPEWQNTDDAKQTYQNVAYSLAKGFGRMP